MGVAIIKITNTHIFSFYIAEQNVYRSKYILRQSLKCFAPMNPLLRYVYAYDNNSSLVCSDCCCKLISCISKK